MVLKKAKVETSPEAQLIRMRRIATGLLAMMACVFVGARLMQPRLPWLEFVVAFAEAAMVGALADWFAVTALFRAPFGLPIPHTAIIPRNKDRIAVSVANFLEHNFLTAKVIAVELAAIDFAGVASNWLMVPKNSRAISLQIVGVIPAALRMMEDEDLSQFLQSLVTRSMANMRCGPSFANMIAILIAQQHHQQLFDHLIKLALLALEEHKPLIRQKIHERSPRWIPKSVDERFFIGLLQEIEGFLNEMSEPESNWRQRFQAAIETWIVELRTSPELEGRIANFLMQTMRHPLFRSYTEELWRDIRSRILNDLQAEDSYAVSQLDRGLRALATALMQEPAVRLKLNVWVSDFATHVLVERRAVIADLVRRVIQTWDAHTVSRKFEFYVGRDLQYIRINGTIVGGLVGLLLHIVSLAI